MLSVSDLQRDPSPSVSFVKNELIFLQRAAHLHLILAAVSEVTRYTLRHIKKKKDDNSAPSVALKMV